MKMRVTAPNSGRARSFQGWFAMPVDPREGLAFRTACPLADTEILLVHGMSSSHRYWGENLGPLGARRRVVAPDLLGFGRSPKPDDSRYGPAEHAAALARLLEQSERPVTVVGHSLGALLSLHLAVRYPRLIRGVALLSLPFFETEAEARQQLARGSAMARLQIEHRRLARLFCWGVCHARPLMRAAMPLLERDVPPAAARAAVDHTWASASRTVAGVILGTRPRALLDQLPAERLLLIHAADDPTAPARAVSTYGRSRAGVEVIVFPGGGHHPYLSQRDAVCQAIAKFVDRLPDAPLG